jgi:hypothetical protein
MPNDPTMDRLEDQIAWYDKNSLRCHLFFKVLKAVVIVCAALIPLLSGLQVTPPWLIGSVGALIAVLEGLQQLNQYQQNWIRYRSTCESLKREKYLYLAKAGPYAGVSDEHALLAERIESLGSQEEAKWVSAQEKPEERAKKND